MKSPHVFGHTPQSAGHVRPSSQTIDFGARHPVAASTTNAIVKPRHQLTPPSSHDELDDAVRRADP